MNHRYPIHRTVNIFITSLITALLGNVRYWCQQSFQSGEEWLFADKKAQYGLAVTRILLGLVAFGLLVTNWTTRLYTFGAGAAWSGEIETPNSAFPRIWLFSAFNSALENNARFSVLYIMLLLLSIPVILGWRFRITGPIFWVMWVSFVEVNDLSGDQSDNIYRIAFLLMIFADPAKQWSLDARRRRLNEWFAEGSPPNQIGTLLHNLAIIALTAQVILVYGSGAMFKSQGAAWREGVAVYETLSVARFNTWPELSEIVIAWGPAVAIATLGSIFLQALFGIMLINRSTRLFALFGILTMHLGIGVLMGLPWFSVTMIAIDAIFIRDRSWKRLGEGVVNRWNESSGRGTTSTISGRTQKGST